MSFDSACLRKTANWSALTQKHKFEKPTFDTRQVLEDLPKMSPKLKTLLDNIQELDSKDMLEHGKYFKHFIFSEVKQGGYGVKIISSAMIASGYSLAYDRKLKVYIDQDLVKTKNNNFMLLCSTDVYGNKLSARKKKELLDKYNQRPDNSQGELVRFILLDSGFKEGIDLFDVKYVHIFEPQTSKADLKQAIGRATRLCGQKGLDFHPTRGWPLRVYLYDVSIPKEINYDSETLYKLYLKNNGIDLRLMDFVDELEKYSIISAIDYELNKNVHNFELEDDEYTIPLYKLLQEGGKVFCKRKCGVLRRTKHVPVSIPLFLTVMAAQARQPKVLEENQRLRGSFCELLRTDPKFCKGVQEAWEDPINYIIKNQDQIKKSIKDGYYNNIPTFNKNAFKNLIKKSLPDNKKPDPKVIADNLKQVQAQVDKKENQNVKTATPNEKIEQQQAQDQAPQALKEPQAQQAPKEPQASKEPQALKEPQAQQASKEPQAQQAQQAPVKKQNIVSAPVKPLLKTPPAPARTPVTPVEKTPASHIYPVPKKLMNFIDMRNFIRDNYIEYTWPKVTLENLCGPKGGSIVKFTPTQDLIRNIFTHESAYKGMLLWHSVGTGKCHAKNTPILMYDGSIKLVQNIEVGDIVMGDDSKPRNVLSLGQGKDKMYRIEQPYGDNYIVNSEHILCLKSDSESIIEIEVKDYIKLKYSEKIKLKGYKSAIEFNNPPEVFDAYDIGYELPKNANIPDEYKFNKTSIRLDVRAGIIDNMGSYDKFNYYIESTSKDVVFIARSLGFDAKVEDSTIIITGKGIEKIPVRDPYLQADICNLDVLNYPIHVYETGYDDYYGFTLDGNNCYLLGDFTVTHNTCCAIATATSSFEKAGYTILWVTRTTLKSDIWKNIFDQVCSIVIQERIKSGQNIPVDFSKRMRLLSKSWKIKPISYKQFSNLVSGKNQLYKDLVAINGAHDPLKRTLLIIDEAHKLYGGSDLSAIERPNMPKLHSAIMNSYAKSGDESVKVLLMTATPITNDAMELPKLLNLCREQQLPTTYEKFSEIYLNEFGKFTKNGMRTYLDDIAGTISYLSREKDARQFAQANIVQIMTPLSQSEFGNAQLEELKKNYDDKLININQEIDHLKNKSTDVKKERIRMKKELKDRCNGLRAAEKLECIRNAENDISYIDRRFEDELIDYTNNINKLKAYGKDLKKDIQVKAKLAKEDVSQQAIIETKCAKKAKKQKKIK